MIEGILSFLKFILLILVLTLICHQQQAKTNSTYHLFMKAICE